MEEKQKQDIISMVKRMPSYMKLIYKLYRDKDVPGRAKVTLSLALGYSISPIDLIPGFIPVLGQIDDVYFALKLLKKALAVCPEDISKKHMENCSVTLEAIDSDIATSGQAMKDIGRAALRVSGKALKATGSAVYRLGKKAWDHKNKK